MHLRALVLLLTFSLPAAALPPVKTVFLIVMENQGWAAFKSNPAAPYLNNVLLPQSSYCERFYATPGLHPSLPNYIWMEAGTNHGIWDNNDPSVNHLNTTNHLVAQLQAAGISWKTYQEDIDGLCVPLTYTNLYAPRHNPFVYFDDLTGTNNPNDAYGIAHNRPYSELAADLTNQTVARYNFLKPNLCNDGHDTCPPLDNPIAQVDAWLASEVPKLLTSAAYSDNGAVFITFDESFDDTPIAMVVLSPLARGDGYFNYIHYTHSSMLRTFQEFFEVGPFLGDAANATNLADLFCRYRVSQIETLGDGRVQLTAAGVVPGRTNVVQASPDFVNWTNLSTHCVATNTFTVTDNEAQYLTNRYYRLVQMP